VRRVVFGVLAVLVVGAVGVYWNLNRIVRRVVEVETTESTYLPTTVDAARLSIFRGQLNLDGFQLGSPPGAFEAPYVVRIAEAEMEMAYRELWAEPVHVRRIVLRRATLYLEQRGLLLNVDPERTRTRPPGKKRVRLVVDRIDVEDAEVVILKGFANMKEERRIRVPMLVLKDVGKAAGPGGERGVYIKEVLIQLIMALADKGLAPDEVNALAAQIVAGKLEQMTKSLSGGPALGAITKPFDFFTKGSGKNGSATRPTTRATRE